MSWTSLKVGSHAGKPSWKEFSPPSTARARIGSGSRRIWRVGRVLGDGRALRLHVAALALFVALALALTYPLALHLADHVRDNADTYEHAWLLSYAAHALVSDPLRVFDANIYYPFHGALAYGDPTLGSVLI